MRSKDLFLFPWHLLPRASPIKKGEEGGKKRKKTNPEARPNLHVSKPGLHICRINPSQDPFPLPVRDRPRAAERQINRSLEQLVVRDSADMADFLQIFFL